MKLILKLIFYALFLVAVTPLWSQEILEIKPKAQEKNLAKSLLWEVSGNGLEKSSYVFGTIHLIDQEDYFFPNIAKETFAEAPRIAFEIDMDEMSDMSAMFSVLQDAFMKDGLTLKDLMNDEDYQLVSDHFQKLGLPMMMMERIKPMFLSVLTSGDIDMSNMESGETVSYEMKLYDQAQQAGKTVEGLETIDFQMSLFDSIPYEAQAQMLIDGIKMSDEGADQFEEMVRIYKEQDIDGMHSMIGDEASGISEYEELLVRKRNENWIPKMKSMMSLQATFFAVGAGHLGGPYGVIRLLQSEGYTLTPLMHLKGVRRI